MSPRHLALSACLLALALPATASADSLRSTLGQPVTEISHEVRVEIDAQGVASYRVRRAFANTGTRHDEAVLSINLPPGAVATNLRIRGAKRWYDGQLLPAARAASRYEEMTGMGEARPMDPALLHWESYNELTLQIFPVPPGGTATVEYTLRAPTEYADGRHRVQYRLRDDPEVLASPILELVGGTHRWSVGGRPTAPGRPLVLEDVGEVEDNATLEAELVRPHRDLVARLGAVEAGDQRFARVELEAPPRLGEIPEALTLVFVIDTSRSMGDDGVAAQLELARAVLTHAPEARVELVAYQRGARRVLGGFVTARELMPALEGGALATTLSPRRRGDRRG